MQRTFAITFASSLHELLPGISHSTHVANVKCFSAMCERWRCMWSAWIQQRTDLMLHNKAKQKMIMLKKCAQDIQFLFHIFEWMHVLSLWAVTMSNTDPAGRPMLYRRVGALRRRKRAYLAYLKTRFHLCKCSELEPMFQFEVAVACTELLLCLAECVCVCSVKEFFHLEWGGIVLLSNIGLTVCITDCLHFYV